MLFLSCPSKANSSETLQKNLQVSGPIETGRCPQQDDTQVGHIKGEQNTHNLELMAQCVFKILTGDEKTHGPQTPLNKTTLQCTASSGLCSASVCRSCQPLNSCWIQRIPVNLQKSKRSNVNFNYDRSIVIYFLFDHGPLLGLRQLLLSADSATGIQS